MTYKLLVVSHGHPAITPGGGENAAYALHRAFQASSGWQSVFLAAAPQAVFSFSLDVESFGSSGDEWVLRKTDDWMHFQSAVDLSIDLDQLAWLKRYQPDLISVHQIMNLGLDVLFQLRSLFPKARFVYTLHEFLLMCPFHGQLKTLDGRYCHGPEQRSCSDCLPALPERDVVMRKMRIQALLPMVDQFVSPSATVRDRFLAWGIAPELIDVVPNVLPFAADQLSLAREEEANLSHVFALIGNCAPPKGLDLVLEAMVQVVKEHPQARLLVHGPIDQVLRAAAVDDPYAQRVKQLINVLGDRVVLAGAYQQHEIPQLMARIGWVVMASRWLENAPVVIQEALACRRPLLVPAMGGMAEHVRNGLDGLHFEPESADSLARLMALVCTKPEIWLEMQRSLAQPLGSDAAFEAHRRLFERLLRKQPDAKQSELEIE